MMNIQTFYERRESLQSKAKFPFKYPLRYPQFECIEKGEKVFLFSNEYLLDCVPRVGKTSTSLYLSLNTLESKVIVIFTGITTEEEWKGELGKFNISNLKFYSNSKGKDEGNSLIKVEDIALVDMENLDPGYIHVFYCNLMLTERNPQIERNLFDKLFKYKVNYIIDEAHHFVNSNTVQEYIRRINNIHLPLIYLTGTAYTEFCRSFREEIIYRCTYEDLWNYKRAGLIDYCISKMHILIPSEVASILETKKKDYLKLWEDHPRAKEAIRSILKAIGGVGKDKNDLHNFLVVCNSQKECDELNKVLSKYLGCTSRVVYGEAKDDNGKKWDSTSANNHLKANPTTYNFLLTCNKFCTGSTIRELQGVLFLCSTESAIKFVQASFRCASPYDDGREKTDAYIFCFEKYTALGILPRIYNGKDIIYDRNTLKKIQQDIDIKIIDENNKLKEINYSDVIDFRNTYIKGRDSFKNSMKDKNEWLFNIINKYNWSLGKSKLLKIVEEIPKSLNSPNKKYDTSNMKSPNSKKNEDSNDSKDNYSLVLNLIGTSLIELLESFTDEDLIYLKDGVVHFKKDLLPITKSISLSYGFPFKALEDIMKEKDLSLYCYRVVKNRLSKVEEYNG